MEIPVTNFKGSTAYVGGKMIPAGETRMVDAAHVPPHRRPGAAPKAPEPAPDPLRDLLAQPVKTIPGALKHLAESMLDDVMALEQDGQARDAVFKALAAEKLRRAQAASTLAQMQHRMAEFSAAELAAIRANEADHPEIVDAVDQALARRAADGQVDPGADADAGQVKLDAPAQTPAGSGPKGRKSGASGARRKG